MDTTTTLGLDEELFEMANLEPEKTGVDGFVYVSTAFPRHGPRVKYFLKLGKDQPSFSVSIAETPEVLVSSLTPSETDRHAPQVIEFVRRNREKLLDFWNNGTDWPSDRVHTFLNSFERVF
ncbi:MAG: hypothetical protein ABUS48_02800 [Pseudomonadota bacterium]